MPNIDKKIVSALNAIARCLRALDNSAFGSVANVAKKEQEKKEAMQEVADRVLEITEISQPKARKNKRK